MYSPYKDWFSINQQQKHMMYKVHQVLQPAGVVLDAFFLSPFKETLYIFDNLWDMANCNIAKNGSFATIKSSSTVFLTVKELLEDGPFKGDHFYQSITIFKIFDKIF